MPERRYAIAFLALFLAIGIALAGSDDARKAIAEKGAKLPKGAEIVELRTEKSRHYSNGDGSVTTDLFAEPVHRRDESGNWVPLGSDVITNCYPQNVTYWTGRAYESGSKTSGYLRVRYYTSTTSCSRGWAKFDLTAIPDGDVIMGCTLNYYVYTAYGSGYQTRWHVCSVDPVTASGINIFNAIGSGAQVTGTLNEQYPSGYWMRPELNPAGLAAIQSGLAGNWVAFGWNWVTTANTNYRYAYAYNGTYPPYLRVIHGTPLPNDIGVTAITPFPTPMFTGTPYPVQITVHNFGSNAVGAPIPVGYNPGDGSPAVNENTPFGLAVGASANYTFSANYTPGTTGSFTFSAYTRLGADPDRSNDTTYVPTTICPLFHNLPFSKNFEEAWGPYANNPPHCGWHCSWDGTPGTSDWHRATSGWSSHGGAYAWLNYYESENPSYDSLISPRLNCTGLVNITLNCSTYWDPFGSAYSGALLGSTDGGATWPHTLRTYNLSSGYLNTYETFLCSWANNQANVKFAWVGTGDIWDLNYWGVDDVLVNGVPPSPDLEITWVSGINPGMQAASFPTNPTVHITNVGTLPFNAPCPLQYWETGPAPAPPGPTVEFPVLNIPVGATVPYTFVTPWAGPFVGPAPGPYDITFTLLAPPGDVNPLNDQAVHNFFLVPNVVASMPINEPFNSGIAAWTVGGPGTAWSADNWPHQFPPPPPPPPMVVWRSETPIATDSKNAGYQSNSDTYLRHTAAIDLTSASCAWLDYNELYNTESGFDYCRVEVSTNGGATWNTLANYCGTNSAFPNWNPATGVNLTGYVGGSILVQFLLHTDVSVTLDGWYIDNVLLTTAAIPAPTLTGPADGDTLSNPAVNFYWSGVGAPDYYIEIDDDPGFGSPNYYGYTGGATNWLSPAMAEGHYYWHVRGEEGPYVGFWSTAWDITIDLTPPAVPTRTAPPEDTIANNLPLLDWSYVSDARQYNAELVSHWIQNIQQPAGDDSSAYQLIAGEELADGVYNWRTQAIDYAGNASAWSSNWWFAVDLTPPAVPTLIYPIGGEAVEDTLLTFDWAPISDARVFHLSVFDEGHNHVTGSPWTINQSAGADNSEYTLQPGEGLADGEHTWAVEAADYVGNSSGYCPEEGFQIMLYLPCLPGWHETNSHVPTTPTDKPVKQGGWLAYLGTTDAHDPIYVHKGYKTTDFYAYYPDGDSWKTLTGMPYSTHPNEKWARKPPYKGSKGVQVGDVVYVTQGNNTLGFWSYHTAGDSWHVEEDVPVGPDRKKVKGGADMTYVPAFGSYDDYVYLLKGYRSEFYRFNLSTKTWDAPLEQVPTGARAKMDKGSWCSYNQGETDGEHLIYILKSKYGEFYKYWIEGDSYTKLADMPLRGWHSGKIKDKKKPKDGGCGSYWNGQVYALKGGNTQQFFQYFPVGDTWHELDTLPNNGSTGKKKRVKYGADIVHYGGGCFYALKGNKTAEVWIYGVGTTPFAGLRPERSGVMAGMTKAQGLGVSISPNPLATGFATLRYSLPKAGPAVVSVFDVAGRSVAVQSVLASRTGAVNLDLRKLAAGIYLVRLDASDYSSTHKLVVQH